MKKSGSYHIEDWGNEKQNTEIQRLKDQAEITVNKDKIYFNHLNLDDIESIYEPGCGPGFYTQELLKIFPKAEITAVDSSDHMVEFFKNNLSDQELSRVNISKRDVTNSGFDDDMFDFAVVRALLQHIPSYDKALDDIVRVLKPGGVIYIVDRDDGVKPLIQPKPDNFDEFLQKFSEYQRQRGGNPYIARELPAKLLAHDFVDVEFFTIPFHSAIEGFSFLDTFSVDTFKPIIDAGVIKREEAENMIQEFKELRKDPNFLTITQGFVICGKKPTK